MTSEMKEMHNISPFITEGFLLEYQHKVAKYYAQVNRADYQSKAGWYIEYSWFIHKDFLPKEKHGEHCDDLDILS